MTVPIKTLTLSDLENCNRRADNAYELGDSKSIYVLPPGYAQWIEWGIMYAAPTVVSDRKHNYVNDYTGKGFRSGSCICGCYMGGSSSSGPVDPFGPCPGSKN